MGGFAIPLVYERPYDGLMCSLTADLASQDVEMTTIETTANQGMRIREKGREDQDVLAS